MALYIDYADEIQRLILDAALTPCERLPSVREVSRRRGLSVSTVLQAYRLLEARGLVEARPRSGYYVSPRNRADPRQPDRPVTTMHAMPSGVPVDRGGLIHEVLEATRSRDLVPMGSAFPDPRLFPLARLRRSIYRGLQHVDAHQSVEDLSPGNAALRRQIAVRYHLDGQHVDPDEIVITNGALEALNLCLQAVTRPGDTVLIESPTFYGALQSIERLGRRAIELPIDPVRGLDPDRLKRQLAVHRPAACWLMPTFQNPTGALVPAAAKQAIVELLAAHEVPLIEDDAYAELYYGARRPPPARVFDRTGNILHCGSFSKSLAPGYRIGWAMPGRYVSCVLRYKLESTLAASLPAQVGIADYLRGTHYDTHLTTLREQLRRRRDGLIDLVRTHFPAGVEFTRPEGGYVMWLRLPQGISARRLYHQALAAGVGIAPGVLFGCDDTFDDHIRLNYGHPSPAALERGIVRLAGILTEQSE
ncbi:PLP-dependent aminotransferase family protein [Salinisphaera sp. T31B1]|uniref:aminotransferase-like domain-containing protein n=1 Tax=Salinisphaera sp. T31B1 TaxID=727963 RepID=UPI003342A237